MQPDPDIYALCECDYYDFPNLRVKLSQQYQTTGYRNVLHLAWQEGDAFIFDYGVVVFWNIAVNAQKSLLSALKEFVNDPVQEKLDDEFTYEISEQASSLKNDHIILPDADIMTRLAISHGIAQSTKLGQYENRVQRTIASTEYIPVNIARSGRSGLRRKELAKLRGQLYLTKSDVTLHFDLLDVPDFFWDNPELQPYYSMVADYLEIKPRIDVLIKKLETIQDLLTMIADEQNHKHSSMLEWIIIWLIAIDIVIILAQEIFLRK
ncbi:RMD1 family protein [Kaarinaea lacus]